MMVNKQFYLINIFSQQHVRVCEIIGIINGGWINAITIISLAKCARASQTSILRHISLYKNVNYSIQKQTKMFTKTTTLLSIDNCMTVSS